MKKFFNLVKKPRAICVRRKIKKYPRTILLINMHSTRVDYVTLKLNYTKLRTSSSLTT